MGRFRDLPRVRWRRTVGGGFELRGAPFSSLSFYILWFLTIYNLVTFATPTSFTRLREAVGVLEDHKEAK